MIVLTLMTTTTIFSTLMKLVVHGLHIRYDHDNDGIWDSSDLDDDNDGLSDWFEANDGNPLTGQFDHDNDGVSDHLDDDDDNDGILDALETV